MVGSGAGLQERAGVGGSRVRGQWWQIQGSGMGGLHLALEPSPRGAQPGPRESPAPRGHVPVAPARSPARLALMISYSSIFREEKGFSISLLKRWWQLTEKLKTGLRPP